MKYMGSKQSLLRNGLGEMVLSAASEADRFVDLFSGTGAVAHHVATNRDIPVCAVDLQEYAAALAGSILLRSAPSPIGVFRHTWLDRVRESMRRSRRATNCPAIGQDLTADDVHGARELCLERSRVGPVWNAYGGYYYSPKQALTFDYMMKHLPERPDHRAVCLAALLRAASRCAASPGHTAQPFNPNPSALPSIKAAWQRDAIAIADQALDDIAPQHAMQLGRSVVADANDFAEKLDDGDLVFVDPPYSSAQYSRFYHVLETMARGQVTSAEGSGRYPPIAERPQSAYSRKTEASGAMEGLLDQLSLTRCTVIVTFPLNTASNGLQGEKLIEMARERFTVDLRRVDSRFSTLGGNGNLRAARLRSTELILRLQPRAPRHRVVA